jgi:hypothetical protein
VRHRDGQQLECDAPRGDLLVGAGGVERHGTDVERGGDRQEQG